MSDPKDHAEVFDEDVVDTADDFDGDEYRAGLPEFPPDEPLGVEATGTTPVEEDAGESFAERDAHHRPGSGIRPDGTTAPSTPAPSTPEPQ